MPYVLTRNCFEYLIVRNTDKYRKRTVAQRANSNVHYHVKSAPINTANSHQRYIMLFMTVPVCLDAARSAPHHTEHPDRPTVTTPDEQHTLISSPFYSLVHPLVSSSLSQPNTTLSTFCPYPSIILIRHSIFTQSSTQLYCMLGNFGTA